MENIPFAYQLWNPAAPTKKEMKTVALLSHLHLHRDCVLLHHQCTIDLGRFELSITGAFGGYRAGPMPVPAASCLYPYIPGLAGMCWRLLRW